MYQLPDFRTTEMTTEQQQASIIDTTLTGLCRILIQTLASRRGPNIAVRLDYSFDTRLALQQLL